MSKNPDRRAYHLQRYALHLFHDAGALGTTDYSTTTFGMTYSNGQARPITGQSITRSSQGSSSFSRNQDRVQMSLTSSFAPVALDRTSFSREVGQSSNGAWEAYETSGNSPTGYSNEDGAREAYSGTFLGALDDLLIGC